MVKLGVCLQAVSLPSLPAVLVFKDGTYYTYNGETDTGCVFLLCTKMADKTKLKIEPKHLDAPLLAPALPLPHFLSMLADGKLTKLHVKLHFPKTVSVIFFMLMFIQVFTSLISLG